MEIVQFPNLLRMVEVLFITYLEFLELAKFFMVESKAVLQVILTEMEPFFLTSLKFA